MTSKDRLQARYFAYWLDSRGFSAAALEVMTQISVYVLREKERRRKKKKPINDTAADLHFAPSTPSD